MQHPPLRWRLRWRIVHWLGGYLPGEFTSPWVRYPDVAATRQSPRTDGLFLDAVREPVAIEEEENAELKRLINTTTMPIVGPGKHGMMDAYNAHKRRSAL